MNKEEIKCLEDVPYPLSADSDLVEEGMNTHADCC